MLDRGPQFTAEMTKNLNSMLGIETKLLMLFHLQTNRQIEHMNQKLEQYFQFFVNHRQKNWPEWLASAKFVINNMAYSTTKVSLFMLNYGRDLRIGVDLRRKGKMEKAIDFAERMRRIQKEAEVALKKAQEEVK